MNRFQPLLAAVLAAATFVAAAEPAPLTLEKALQIAAQRPPEMLLAATRGLPLRLMASPSTTGIAAADAARLELMARFFEVILTDMDAVASGERMSVAYGHWDRLKARDPESAETLRANLLYRDLLSRRNAAQMNQRLARSGLALAMGQAGKLSPELVEPEFPADDPGSAPDILQPAAPSRGTSAAASMLDHAHTAAMLELDWLLRSERPRARARIDLAGRLLDDAREQLAAGGPSDLGNAMAATVEAKRDELSVEFAIQLARAKLAALTRARK